MIWQRRRELERRLNDEAAVRLATLSLELGLLAVDLRDPAVLTRLTRLQDDVRVIVEELRDVGSELYPPVLVSAGIGAALHAYAERLSLALAVRGPRRRYPERAEASLYFAVVDVIDAVDLPRDRVLSVVVEAEGDDLVATLSGPRTARVSVALPQGGC